MITNYSRIVFIIGIVLFFFIGFVAGTIYGARETLGFCVDMGLKLAKFSGVNISLDDKLITEGLLKYQSNTKSFLNITNG